MLVQCLLLLLVSAKQHSCEDGSTDIQTEVGVPSEDVESEPSTEPGFPNPPKITAATTVTNASESVDLAPTKSSKRTARKRGRRLRGYYQSERYRNNAYNPYNPSSPYSYRARPPQPPYAQAGYYRTGYDNPYYDPYKQGYYNYPNYPQQGYYSYPYQPQQPAPQPGQVPYPPPTPPPTEAIPDLYYVRDSPHGYQYQKVSVAPEVGRPGPAAGQYQPSYGQPPQGYYGYQYDPYRRPPPPAHQPPQSYYQPAQYGYHQDQQSTVYQQQMQLAQRYTYPRGRRPRFMRTGRPTLRTPATEHSWTLTIAPDSQFGQPSDKPQSSSPSEPVTK